MLDKQYPITSSPLVSIVTPSYNQAGYLEETIKSVLSQDYPDIEYIIVDGGSTDGSLEIIQRYSDQLAWWVSEADQGQADAINKGFLHASGEVYAWLNSDDTYLPGAIKSAISYLSIHPEVAMVYADANLVDDRGNILGRFPAQQTNLKRMLRGSVHIPQQTTFYKADIWKEVGGLDPSFYFAMDYDLWVRIAKITAPVYINQLWANFRLHGSGKTIVSDDRCYPEMLRVYQREKGKRLSPLAIRAFIRPLLFSWLPLRLRLWLRRVLTIG